MRIRLFPAMDFSLLRTRFIAHYLSISDSKSTKFTSVDGPRGKLPMPWPGLATWPEAIMACDGLRVVLVVSEWPGLGLASGHARPR